MRIFVTGASGFIGSAIIRELIGAGHSVLGLARSDVSAASVAAAGAEVLRGSLDDVDSLCRGAKTADGVIHTAFIHDFSKFVENCEIDRHTIMEIASALEGTDKPMLVTSGTGLAGTGRVATENDRALAGNPIPRVASEEAADAAVKRGARVAVVRLPQVHGGDGKAGLITYLFDIARKKGVSAYVGEGRNRWPAAHRLDVAVLYRLALEKAVAGARYHAVADEGVPVRDIAAVLARQLNVPLKSISPVEAEMHFGWLAHFVGADNPSSSALTHERLGWQPKEIGLIADISREGYFKG
jgi:nucleoside-diphosphate-sugar epimerase